MKFCEVCQEQKLTKIEALSPLYKHYMIAEAQVCLAMWYSESS